jgi:serine/threonine-protein kinase
MPIAVAMALIEQAATGLHYAHEARDSGGARWGLVHRDVNPANLFVTYDGVVKLGGLRHRQELQRPPADRPGDLQGDLRLLRPEQVVGGAVDRQTDVFCLGIVFWELLTGRQLFDDGNQVTTIDAVRSRRIDPPSTSRPDIPAEVDAIVLRALDRDRRKRFVSAHQMVGELRALSRQLPMPASKEIGAWCASCSARSGWRSSASSARGATSSRPWPA